MLNHVVFILDRSGSMGLNWPLTISGFNENVEAVKNSIGTEKGISEDDYKVSLVTFNEKVDTIYWNNSIRSLQKLTEKDVQPGGSTSLYDAVGYAIDRLKEEADEASIHSVLFVILTDGQENTSKEYKSKDISKRIKDCEASGKWTFTYMGDNVDLSQVQKDMGLGAGNMMMFNSHTAGGTHAGSMMRTAGLTKYMSDVNASKLAGESSFSKGDFYDDVKKDEEALDTEPAL